MGYQLCDCGRVAEEDSETCFRCRMKTVGFAFRGGGGKTRQAFHERTQGEWMRDNLGTDSDVELGRRGIERKK